ncbi:MAG: flagellar export protein FliJ [Desulfobacterales bacterium]|nr:flagellar export protein FliJ [Desulfobacterales bacterium]
MFKFTLDPLLNHRKFEEETIQKERAELENAFADAEARMREFRIDKDTWEKELEKKQREGALVTETLLCYDFINGLTGKILLQGELIAAIEVKREKKQAELIEAVKRRKTLERLKEKQLHAHEEKMAKKERDQLNEMAILGFGRKTLVNDDKNVIDE